MKLAGSAWALGAIAAACLSSLGCVDEGDGSDFDRDGVVDDFEDTNNNFLPDPGEADFLRTDTDLDGLCDGSPPRDLTDCTGCEDCNDNGIFEPCAEETDPLNDDTDNDGVRDGDDGAPVDGFPVDCSAGGELPYGASLPPGKPFPARPTPTPLPTNPPPTAAPTPTLPFPVS